MQFVINSKVQVIVLGFTAVIRLVISSVWAEICDQNGKLRHFDKSLSKLSVIEMENSDISRMFQICSLKETTNPEYIENLFLNFIPNGLRYLIPSGHFYFNAVDLNFRLSVSACSRLQWPQELWALLRVVSPKLQWFQGTHRGNGSETSVVSRTSTFPLLATFLNGLTYSSK
jgi:hypothetical protein